jgi:hypothetical protein
MHHVQISKTIVQIHARVGEVWALHRNVRKRKNSEMSNSGDNPTFLLVLISSACGRAPGEVRKLQKRTGYRTLWETVGHPVPFPLKYIRHFSHKVPTYKLEDKDLPRPTGLDLWDIDAAAIPICQSFAT